MITNQERAGQPNRALKVALTFDDQTRPETTGVYCRRALEKLVEVAFFHPSRLADVPREGFDLYLNVDDGLRYPWPADLRPCAWWAIDTHIDFAWSLEKARSFDLVFTAQRDGAALLRREGVSAEWLPLACDEEVHGRGREAETGSGQFKMQNAKCKTQNDASGSGAESEERMPKTQDLCAKTSAPRKLESGSKRPHPEGEGVKRFDVCFVGNLIRGPRTDLVRLIQQHFKDVYVGQAYFEEMADVYAASRVVFNRSVANDVNMRVFEALASGSLLMTNDLADNGLAEMFRDGVHLATYSDGHDLLDKLRYYLRRDDAREKIAAAGRAEALAKHTYLHRMAEILRRVREHLCSEPTSCRSGKHAVDTAHAEGAPVAVPSPGDHCKLQIAKCKSQIDASGSTRHSSFNHDWSYFDFARPEVLALIPPTARRVLEIGCGTGRLGEALKRRQACEVVGVELDVLAAQKAAARLDRVIVGDVERMRLDVDDENATKVDDCFGNLPPSPRPSPGGRGSRFDCLVCADVLEHLVDPVGFLRRASAWLEDEAVVVASIPNVRHHSVVGSLIEGNWTYEPTGLLDHTHLHFFTRRDAEATFAKAGYRVEKLQFVRGPGYDEWRQQDDKSQVQIGGACLTGVPLDEAEEFFVYQFLVLAKTCSAAMETHHAERDAYCTANLKTTGGADRPHPGPLPKGEGAAGGQCKTQNAKCKTQNNISGSESASYDRSPKTQDLSPKTFPLNPKSQRWPKCVLLMVTYNRLEYTRLALEAVLKLDYPNLRIVIWDNASTDGTVEYLRERLAEGAGWKTGCHAARPHPGPLPDGEGDAERHRGRSLQTAPRIELIASPVNRGVVFPMNEVWSSDAQAELLAKIDNDTLVPPDLLKRLADCHRKTCRFGVLSGFHFRQEGEALADERRIKVFDGIRVLPQPYVGGCAVMIRAEVFKRIGAVGCRNDGPRQAPFMDSGWTIYQQRLTAAGLVSGYPWPPIHVDHMEDTRSPHCIRSDEHERYKRQERGMGLKEFTNDLCVWRPNW